MSQSKTLSPSPSSPAAERLEIIESERHMMSATSSLSRPSDVSKARFSTWSVLEENRRTGEMVRQEADDRRQQRTAAKLAFREKGNANARAAKAQREAAALRVRQHQDANAHRGHECKDAVAVAVDELHHIQEEWHRHGTENRMRYGVEQKERLLNTLAERHASNQAAATDLKSQEAARHAAHVAARKASLDQKRERVRQIREQTRPEVTANAKEFFFSQRKATADQVRADVSNWWTGKQDGKDSALHAARMNRDAAYATRTHASELHKVMHAEHLRDANEMRANLSIAENEYAAQQAAKQQALRDAHDEAYSAKFVDPDDAEMVTNSAIDQLQNHHRSGAVSSLSTILSEGGKSNVGKSAWTRFFGASSGWFAGWPWSHAE